MSTWKKVWDFLWKQDNIYSWIVNVLIAFIVIKYMVYPALGFVLGTPAPIVAVVSGSMEHDGNFDAFWSGESCCNDACSQRLIQKNYYDSLNITDRMFRGFPFVNGFNKGDIMILYSPEKAEVGDVIVYIANRPDPIIHRVINVENDEGRKLYWTKGDHNCDVGGFEQHIPEERVIGKAVWRVPFLGWVKIGAVWIWQVATEGFR